MYAFTVGMGVLLLLMSFVIIAIGYGMVRDRLIVLGVITTSFGGFFVGLGIWLLYFTITTGGAS